MRVLAVQDGSGDAYEVQILGVDCSDMVPMFDTRADAEAQADKMRASLSALLAAVEAEAVERCRVEEPPKDKPPEAPFTIEIHAHGETWEALLREVRDAATHIQEHGPACARVGGGGGGGGYITVRTVPGLTAEAYRAALAEWFERQPARRSPRARGRRKK